MDSYICHIAIFKRMLGFLLIFLLTSCNYFSERENRTEPITEIELNRYASKLDQRMREFPNDAFSSQFNNDFFMNRIYEAGYPKSLLDMTVENTIESTLNLLSHQLGVVIANDQYELVKINTENGHLIYRMYTDEGLNYHELMVIKSKGLYKIGDIYVHSSGEYLSETLARFFVSSLEVWNPLIKKFSEEKVKGFSYINRGRDEMGMGNFWIAKEYLDSARSLMHNEKTWHLLNITCSSQLDSSLYMKSVQDFKVQFENDPSWMLMGIDYYFSTQEWSKMKDLIDGIRMRVGKDPILNLFEANMEVFKGDNYDRGIELINEGIREKPEFQDFYYTKALLEGLNDNFSEAASTLEFMYNEFGISMYELDYTLIPEFRNSNYYTTLESQQSID